MSQRGAFILNSVGHKQLTTIVQKYTVGTGTNTSTYYVPIVNSWESAGAIGTYGWWAGGAPGTYSSIDRLDFANDTVSLSPRTPSPFGLTLHTFTGNANYGYLAGGNNPGDNSLVNRIDYSNDSPTAPGPRGPLSVGRSAPSAVSNANYGWFVGGVPGPLSRVDRIDYSNDSPASASIRGPLSAARGYIASTANANYAWFNAGNLGTSIVDRMDFSSDSPTAASPRGPLSSTNSKSAAAAGNTNYGWFAGGNPSTTNSVVNRIDYSNDTATGTTRGPLSVAKYQAEGAGNANFGWFGGGTNNSVDFSNVDRIDYSNDSPTAATQRTSLAFVRRAFAATSNYVKALPNFVGVGSVGTGTFGVFGTPAPSTGIAQIGGTYGWFGGDQTTSLAIRINFSNDSPTSGSFRGPFPMLMRQMAATGNANYGWFAGGQNPSVVIVSTVNRIDYSNDSPTAVGIRGSLSVTKFKFAAAGNANYGWFAGGNVTAPTPATSSVERIDFANDSPVAASPRGPLSAARTTISATSNANYAWFGLFELYRIDFSNDSPTAASPRGRLVAARYETAAAGNANYGWFGGGVGFAPSPPLSTVDRIDYANDSPTSASPRGGLNTPRSIHAAAGNDKFGWFGGGTNPTPVVISSVDRIDYSNDSPTSASPRGLLGTGMVWTAAASNYVKYPIDPRSGGLNVNLYASTSTYNTATGVTIYNGTFGWVSGTASSVERIDFANDAATASVRGPLSLARMLGSTTHNTQYGWFIGGLQPASPYARYSTVDRIDYANDSPTAATVRGNLSIAKAQHTSMGNINYGWVAGGETLLGTSSLFSSVDRIDYSNESPASSSPRGPLTAARGYMDATANEYYGWVAGGGFTVSPTAYSTVERIDFANDSPTAAASRSRLQTATYEIAGAGNRNYGWFNRGGASTSLVERLDYSNDTVNTLLRGSLSQVRSKHSAASNSSYGWWIGGFVTPNPVSTVDRIDFSNDSPTASTARGPLAATRYGTASASNYVTTLLTGFVVPQYNQASASVGTNPQGTYGWHVAGNPGTNAVVNRIDLSNDSPTSASPRGSLVTGRNSFGGAGNANYGWFGGGQTVPATASSVERIDYSNDAVSATTRGPLSAARYFIAAMSNVNYGYWIGGRLGPVSTIDRIDFANDSPTSASVRGSMSSEKESTMPVSNASYGWITGNASSTVERIDFSNDSPTSPSRRGPLSTARSASASVGNSNYGWVAGGGPAGTAVDRIDYSNDSPTAASPRSTIILPGNNAIQRSGASGNSNYGWFSGGFGTPGPTGFSSVCRLDFNNDTITATVRGPLAAVKYQHASASNYVK